jgi:phosphatidylserine/phosphatidylglycerophosphate/cardiolipin synthase-like enzyme
VHAKVCLIDDAWASTGSDNFSRRSWTHDSELTAVVLDESYTRDLRLTLAAEHLDRLDDVGERGLEAAMPDCLDPAEMFEVYAAHADRLDAWHASGRRGPRPPGRLRRLPMPRLTPRQRQWAALPLDVLHDPDGRPPALRGTSEY